MNSWKELVTPKSPLTQAFPDCAVTDLSHFGLIRAGGADLRTFLQGQLTNDVNQVGPDLAQLSSYCSPKGRMLGSFWIFQRGDALYLQLPAERLDAILKRLRMFVLRAQVTLEDASAELARFGVAGDCAADLLPFAPAADRASITRDDITVIRLPADRPRFEVIGPPEALGGLWAAVADRAVQTGPDFWALLDIRAGIPNVFEDTVEAFVPQMANLQLVGGVSFTKGCYTGQEVVARMQYLGKLKRRMHRVHIDSGDRPAPGSEVFSPSSESGQGAGRIVDAAPSPEGGFEALAVLQISSAEADDLRLGDAAGPALRLLDLPYTFPPADG
jgi:folate-binding protein YgfZ